MNNRNTNNYINSDLSYYQPNPYTSYYLSQTNQYIVPSKQLNDVNNIHLETVYTKDFIIKKPENVINNYPSNRKNNANLIFGISVILLLIIITLFIIYFDFFI